MQESEQATRMEIRRRAIVDHDKAANYFADQYMRLAEDHFYSSFTYGRRKIDDLILQLVADLEQGVRVLDVGCGTGEQIRFLRRLGLDAEGVEPSSSMRSVAKETNPGVPIGDGVATDLPYDDRSLSMVMAIEVLRYLHRADVLNAYREMYRVLSPGGRAVFTMANRYALNGFFLFDAARRSLFRFLGRREPIHCEFVTPGLVRRDLKEVGFTDIAFSGRVVVPIRPLYAVNADLGAWFARALEPLDDRLSRMAWTVPLAAMLLVVARKPGPVTG